MRHFHNMWTIRTFSLLGGSFWRCCWRRLVCCMVHYLSLGLSITTNSIFMCSVCVLQDSRKRSICYFWSRRFCIERRCNFKRGQTGLQDLGHNEWRSQQCDYVPILVFRQALGKWLAYRAWHGSGPLQILHYCSKYARQWSLHFSKQLSTSLQQGSIP